MLAGIVVSNVIPYLENVYYLPSLWRQNQYDCVSVAALAEVGAEGGEGWTEGKRRNERHHREGHGPRDACFSPSALNRESELLVRRNAETSLQPRKTK